MTFEEVVNTIREKLSGADTSAIEGRAAIQVNLTGRIAGTFYIEILDGKLSVEPYEYYDRDAMVTLSATNFLKLIEGKADPVEEATAGRIQFEGSAERALQIIELGKQVQEKEKAKKTKSTRSKTVKKTGN